MLLLVGTTFDLWGGFAADENADKNCDERQTDEPEGVVVETRRENGASGCAEEKAEDDEGKLAEFAQPALRLAGLRTSYRPSMAVRRLPVMKVEL